MLPGALWVEGVAGVMINSERNLTFSPKAVEPPGEAMPDWEIITQVACEMGYLVHLIINLLVTSLKKLRNVLILKRGMI